MTNILFPDGLIVFGQANEEEAQTFMECLRRYGSWSGKIINQSESKVHFSKNVNDKRAD